MLQKKNESRYSIQISVLQQNFDKKIEYLSSLHLKRPNALLFSQNTNNTVPDKLWLSDAEAIVVNVAYHSHVI